MINIVTYDDKIVVSFQQDINFETSRIMEETIQSQPWDTPHLQIDLSAVRFIDSSGVRLLISWLYPLKDRVRIEMTGVSAPIKHILSICQLDQIVDIK